MNFLLFTTFLLLKTLQIVAKNNETPQKDISLICLKYIYDKNVNSSENHSVFIVKNVQIDVDFIKFAMKKSNILLFDPSIKKEQVTKILSQGFRHRIDKITHYLLAFCSLSELEKILRNLSKMSEFDARMFFILMFNDKESNQKENDHTLTQIFQLL